MNMQSKNLAVILARGGSKGVPKKNIKLLQGKPLIAYTIQAAIDSQCFEDIVVSTDCKNIAEVAKSFGAKVPFMRPDELALDHVWSRDALKHAVLETEKILGKKYDIITELPCVSPLRQSADIVNAMNLMMKNDVDSVTSFVLEHDKHPQRAKFVDEIDNLVSDFTKEFPEGEGSRRQDLIPCYFRNGSIFIMTRECIVDNFSRHGSRCMAYIMPPERSINIDTMLDWKFAEFLMGEKNED